MRGEEKSPEAFYGGGHTSFSPIQGRDFQDFSNGIQKKNVESSRGFVMLKLGMAMEYQEGVGAVRSFHEFFSFRSLGDHLRIVTSLRDGDPWLTVTRSKNQPTRH
jgi:hypothetical protein